MTSDVRLPIRTGISAADPASTPSAAREISRTVTAVGTAFGLAGDSRQQFAIRDIPLARVGPPIELAAIIAQCGIRPLCDALAMQCVSGIATPASSATSNDKETTLLKIFTRPTSPILSRSKTNGCDFDHNLPLIWSRVARSSIICFSLPAAT